MIEICGVDAWKISCFSTTHLPSHIINNVFLVWRQPKLTKHQSTFWRLSVKHKEKMTDFQAKANHQFPFLLLFFLSGALYFLPERGTPKNGTSRTSIYGSYSLPQPYQEFIAQYSPEKLNFMPSFPIRSMKKNHWGSIKVAPI